MSMTTRSITKLPPIWVDHCNCRCYISACLVTSSPFLDDERKQDCHLHDDFGQSTQDAENQNSWPLWEQTPVQRMVLYIHGLDCTSEDMKAESAMCFGEGTLFIAPDLVGHGKSSISKEDHLIAALSIENQSALCLKALQHVSSSLIPSATECLETNVCQVPLHVVGHSMGGAIAACLCVSILNQTREQTELLFSTKFHQNASPDGPMPILRSLCFEEGNVDGTDCFNSKILLSKGVRPAATAKHVCIFHASKFLVEYSERDIVLSQLKHVRNCDVRVQYLLGQRNFGKFESLRRISDAGLSIQTVPEAGHWLHRDNAIECWGMIWACATIAECTSSAAKI